MTRKIIGPDPGTIILRSGGRKYQVQRNGEWRRMSERATKKGER